MKVLQIKHILLNDVFGIPVIFSRAAVVCMILGFITLLVTVAVAVYKSNQQKQQFIKASKKSVLGMCLPLYFLDS